MKRSFVMVTTAGFVACMLLAFLGRASVLAAGPVVWAVGPQLEKQLESTAGISWEANPLRPALTQLSAAFRVAIFIDRRFDPAMPINYTANDMPLDELLQRLALTARGKLSYVGSVAYIGPPETAEKLATIAGLRQQEIDALPSEAKLRLNRMTAMRWNEPGTPGDLLEQVCKEAGLTITNPQLVLFDQWTAGDWPAMRLVDRLTLLLAGYDLTFELSADAKSLTLKPMPDKVSLKKYYVAGAKPADMVKSLQKNFPKATVTMEGARISVDSSMEDHRLVDRVLKGLAAKRTTVTSGKQVFTLSVENLPIRGTINSLAKKLEMKVEYEKGVGNKADLRTTFSVKEATLQQMLDAALKPAGLGYEIKGNTIHVIPGK